jgi:hypothetical protein
MKPANVVILLAVVAALLLLVAGPGVRMDWWAYGTGFQLMRWAAYLGMGTIGLSILLLLLPHTRRVRTGGLVLAMVIGIVVAAIPLRGLQQARSVPPIHDISTDLADPPVFVAVLPLRRDAANGAEHEGEVVAEQQRAAYPGLKAAYVASPPQLAFERALDAARAMRWEIIDADAASGRIEATDTTLWFGFKDDVVIRVRPEGAGSRIDVRSVSRVGRSDVGANAARIRAYLQRVSE